MVLCVGGQSVATADVADTVSELDASVAESSRGFSEGCVVVVCLPVAGLVTPPPLLSVRC